MYHVIDLKQTRSKNSNGMEISRKIFFRKLEEYFTRLSSFSKIMQLPIFHSVLASSFGCDHSELDISRRDDGDVHSIKKKHFRSFLLVCR